MTAVKKKLLIVLTCVAMLFAGIAILSACSGDNGDLKVTFMVQSDDGSWGKYDEKAVTDGSVEMPANPTKEYYTFTNWYSDKDFSGDPFTGKDLKESATVYARFIPVEVDIYINGQDEGTQNLIDVVNGTYDPGENLEFDGWYTNANYTEASKWNGTDTVNTLYARSVARITFNDGYQDVYITTVTPNSVFADPATSGVETANILQTYMSKYDISYWDEDGNEFDFSEPITENTTINVKWRSPFWSYELNETTNRLSLTSGSRGNNKYDDTETNATESNVPVMSILSEITFDKDGDGVAEKYYVDEVRFDTDVLSSSVLEKVIVGDGIKIIQNFVSSGASSVKEIVLPSSLRVIQNCFNNLNSLQSITIPDGVEVILGSFWANTSASYSRLTYLLNKGEEYPFEIAIPDSVKNLSAVPYNLTFSKTKDMAKQGDFYKENNRIYKIDDSTAQKGKLLLIADFNDNNGSLSVPEGVNGIQVGAFFNRELNYLTLPSTFSYIGYNESISSYPEYTYGFSESTYSMYSDCMLWDERYANDPKGHICPLGFAVFNTVDNLEYLVFYGEKITGTAADYAFVGDPMGYASMSESYFETYTANAYAQKVVFIGETEEPQVTITFENSLTGGVYEAVISKNKNDVLTTEEILKAIDDQNNTNFAKAYEDKVLMLGDINSFGKKYDLDTPLTTNIYLNISSEYKVEGGFTYKDNGDGTATVTGLNNETAYKAPNDLYIIGIPASVNGLTITSIEANAFNAINNSDAINIGYVVISSSVANIGDKAFYGCEGLVVLNIAPGGLESIGASAFEGTSLVTIALPLSSLKEVGAYAFKIETLEQFLPAVGEEERNMLTKNDLKAGDFFIRYEDSVGVGLYQYESKTENEGNVIWNVKYIATAIKFYSTGEVQTVNLGDISDSGNIIRYEVMSGSYYFLTADAKIYFNCVSKIHANAFTDCATDGFRATSIKYSSEYMGSAESGTITLKELVNDKNCANIFEIGWYEGYTDDGMGAVKCREV